VGAGRCTPRGEGALGALSWRDLAGALASGAALAAAPLAATGELHAPGALAVATLLYALLGATAWCAARCVSRAPRGGRVLAALLLGGLVFWQIREHGDWLHVATRPLATAAALGACVAAAGIAVGRAARAPRAALALSLAGLCASAALADRTDPVLRWHLREHHRLFASVLHRAFDAPVAPLAALFRDAGVKRRAAPPSTPAPGPPAQPAHVVFVLIDTLRADALGSYGARPSPTPALDRRAARAVRFTDVRANAPWTSPSVAAMITGRLPEETGLHELGDALPDAAVTAAEIFRAWGFETAGFVANAAVAAHLGFGQGFGLYREVPAPGAYPRADAVVDEVEAWLAARAEPASPIFLTVHFMDPHRPYLSGGAPPVTAPEHSARAYARELAFLDGQLERLFRALDARLPGPRRVVVTSDHGEAFGEHGAWGHGHSLHPELLHLPLLVFGAEPAAGGDVDARLEGRDVFDLLLAAGGAGATHAADLDAWARDWARTRARPLRYASSYATPKTWRLLPALRPYAARRLRGVETPDASFVWSAFGDVRALYDTRQDPAERRNALTRHPETARALAARLDTSLTTVSLPTRGGNPTDAALDEALRERLAALGYVD